MALAPPLVVLFIEHDVGSADLLYDRFKIFNAFFGFDLGDQLDMSRQARADGVDGVGIFNI